MFKPLYIWEKYSSLLHSFMINVIPNITTFVQTFYISQLKKRTISA